MVRPQAVASASPGRDGSAEAAWAGSGANDRPGGPQTPAEARGGRPGRDAVGTVPVAAPGGRDSGQRDDDVSGVEGAATGAQKKTLHASERDTPRVRALRGHFKKRAAAV